VLLGRAEPILITGGRAVADYREAFFGIDVAKVKNAIAVAESGRDGEVRYFGEVDASYASMRRIILRIAASLITCISVMKPARPVMASIG
jgi:transposase